ncbi:efflux RND transporter permease subunit [Kangiella sediminilitoris]|uniref:Transport protein, putative n=1 Tax=Kangiella sediminilitoris TaxID=1144748 RepID=A0A1B3BBV4_9GAMM|nr:MMPL family transporter [Kangiella sediminilitoris]AOE50269.1 Transport protein, putative [Kangiella sediminilitoris]
MTQPKENFFYNLYKKIILDHPLISLIVVILLTVLAASQLPKFRLDASGESLVLENDKSLTYYRQVNEQYGSDDFLIITWQPNKGLMSDESIQGLKNLTEELKSVQTVSNINSILNVPLLKGMSLDDALDTEIPTLQSGDVKREKALQEFTTSPIYKNLLVGEDGNTSAVQINFERDEKYFELLNARDALRKERKQSGSLTEEKQEKLSRLEDEFDDYSKVVSERTSNIIEEVRTIMDDYRDIANMHLGGISMITNDMLTFIQHDITVFGIGIILFIMLALYLFFGKLRWVMLPLFSCIVSVVMLAGLLSFLDWRITVISSNFPSILLIVILALNVHLAVYYRDYISANPDADLNSRVSTTVRTMFWPCFYTALTTIVAFVSLLISGIRPVIDFGWIMTIGIVLGFVVTFIIFPSFIQLLKKDAHSSGKSMTYKVTNWIYSFTVNFKSVIFLSTIAIIVFSAYGITQLKVENRFIDYFKPSTEIYQGMTVIDQKLGGTTPLDIVIDKGEEDSLVDDDEFADEFGDEFDSSIYDPGYWFTSSKLKQVENIHDYIDSLEVTGKVQSIATYAKVLKEMEGGTYPDEVTLSLVHQKSPEDVKSTLMTPYLSEDGDQIRINIRVEETNPDLKRAELIDNINNYIVNEAGIDQDRVHFTGMLVLYNNMLESLFDSQIMTIGAVYIAILFMFIILFRSFILAILATIPNALSAALVLGIMGWMGVPMDMMTITIAAIVIGIAVDNSIHYVHRFKSEFAKDNDYLATMKRCHGSIGKAIYYTGITVIVGFAILALSEFIPSIYFGLLTGLAMAVALFLNLTLLPLMLITVKPLKMKQD